ncbi:hypothetical protein HanXRQr2_Chr16g0726011 [Helianthus annuus]|uniref:Uncharacterized protein n=1 Tax=Helianthus annuus TaxID=4232 RepID=A0A251RVN9_HELAN|nr:hypothetical protein HanXRQr2_Chr16g0726011 [Helianthus annuus]
MVVVKRWLMLLQVGGLAIHGDDLPHMNPRLEPAPKSVERIKSDRNLFGAFNH